MIAFIDFDQGLPRYDKPMPEHLPTETQAKLRAVLAAMENKKVVKVLKELKTQMATTITELRPEWTLYSIDYGKWSYVSNEDILDEWIDKNKHQL